MTKTATKTTAKTDKFADPFAALRGVMLDTIDAFAEGQARLTAMFDTEFAKAKDSAAMQAATARTAAQAQVDAAVASGEIVAAGTEKLGALIQGEMARAAEDRMAAAKTILTATTVADVVAAQTAAFEAEQGKAKAFADSLAKLTQAVANDALKPVQARMAENLKAFTAKAA